MTRSKDCETFALDLAALSAGEGEATPAMQEHLRRCEACRFLLVALEDQHEALEALEDPPGFEEALSALHEGVMAQIASPAPRRIRRLAPFSWAAAALLLVVAGSVWRLHSVRELRPVPSSHPPQIAPELPAIAASNPVPSIAPVPIRRRHRLPSSRSYDPVLAARRILETASGEASPPGLVQQSPQLVIYWVKPSKGGNS